jgi:hypothetical protein
MTQLKNHQSISQTVAAAHIIQLDIKSTNGYEPPKDKYSIHSEGATDNELNWFDGRDLNSRGLAKEIETTYAYPSGSLRMVHLLARKHHLRTHG